MMKSVKTGCNTFSLMLAVLVLMTGVWVGSVKANEAVLLLKTYQPGLAVTGWLMSEKLDGMRAIWDGHQLKTRGGQIIHAPKWFVASLPPFALDGELWTQRGDFEGVVSIVRDTNPSQAWQKVGYYIFEVPNQAGGLEARLAILNQYLQTHSVPHLKIITQTLCESQTHLDRFFKTIQAQGGEGVVLRDPHTLYVTGRHASALKYKAFEDAECTLTAYKAGTGKYLGQVGALICQMDNNQQVALGSGLSDALRKNPPPLGARVTFKYYGLTANNKPRHPVYWRVRTDE